MVSRLADRPRFETALLTFFAGTGLLLAIVGLYGLIAFMTIQRRHEIGLWILWIPKTSSDLKTQGFPSFVRSWWLPRRALFSSPFSLC
jgi:hypothetical protein